MKKLIIAVFVILVIAGLGLPPVLGSITESQIRAHIDSMDENAATSLVVETYDRGWFSSTASIAVGLGEQYARTLMAAADDDTDNPAAALLSAANVTFDLDIKHGPINLNDGLFLGLSKFVATLNDDSEVVREFQQTLNVPYLLELRGKVGFTGVFNFDADVPPVDYADETGQLLFSGATVAGSVNNQNLKTRGNIDELVFDVEAGSATIERINFVSDTTKIDTYIWTGTAEATIDNAVVADTVTGTEPVIVAQGLRLATQASLDDSGSLLNGTVSYGAASVISPIGDFQLDDAIVGLNATNLSVAGVSAYYEAMLTADPTNPLAAMQSVQQLGAEILGHSPTVSVRPIQFELDGESFAGDIEIRVLGDAVQGQLDLSNPLALLGLVEASANITASKLLIERLAAQVVSAQMGASLGGPGTPQGQDTQPMARTQSQLMLAAFLGQGYLVADGDNYTTNVEYANGQIVVNGTALPLGMMF